MKGALQKNLGLYRCKTDHHGDGHSEWFEGIAHLFAVSGTIGRRVSLEPNFDMAAASASGLGPLEVWWALEDLWLRAAACMAVTVELHATQMRIVVHRLQADWNNPAADLRRPLLDLDTYRCSQGGQQGCYVSMLHNEGDDLVCTLTP